MIYEKILQQMLTHYIDRYAGSKANIEPTIIKTYVSDDETYLEVNYIIRRKGQSPEIVTVRADKFGVRAIYD